MMLVFCLKKYTWKKSVVDLGFSQISFKALHKKISSVNVTKSFIFCTVKYSKNLLLKTLQISSNALIVGSVLARSLRC